MILLLIPVHSFKLARADWLRRHPNPISVSEAIHLDPANSYAYTLQAELFEQQGRPSEAERDWTEALQRSPRNPEASIRLALLMEQRGSLHDAETRLLQAARISHTWLPRWALANFYFRRHNITDFRSWARASLLRSSDDVAGLFDLLEQSGLPPQVLIQEVFPPNRRVLTAWLYYRLQRRHHAGLLEAATQLANRIPDGSAGWPGLDNPPFASRQHPASDSERFALLSSTDRLRELGDSAAAVRLWNSLCEHRILPNGTWSEATPVINPQFRHETPGAGFDWHIARPPGLTIVAEGGSLEVRLSGSQSEQGDDLVYQRVILPAARAYRLVVESRSNDLPTATGLRWEVRDPAAQVRTLPITPTSDWQRLALLVPAAPQPRTVQLALAYARLPGTVRAEGSIEFRKVTLEPLP